jgi:nucleoside-diphosphate-sugar epimerase
MKILITGANGFVGAALCRYFYKLGHQVIATGRQPRPHPGLLACATYLQADISNPIPPFNADACIHAAGLASDTANYNELFLNNVTGTANVLKAAKNCAFFIFISSSSVYNFSGKPVSEEDSAQSVPISDYGKTKLLAEELVQAHIPTNQRRLILRPRAIYGIGDRILLPRLLKLIKRQTIFCPVNKATLTSATHVDNLAFAIDLFFKQADKPALQLFNIADAPVYKLRDMVLKSLYAVGGENLRKVDVPHSIIKLLAAINSKLHFSGQLSPVVLEALLKNTVLNISPIQATLGYKPLYTFDDSCKQIGDWVNRIGGEKVYLQSLTDAPWMASPSLRPNREK